MSSVLVDDADQEFATFQRIVELETEIMQLRAALTTRQQFGQATGLLAARFQVAVDQAKSILMGLSQHLNIQVSTVARILNDEHCGTLTAEAATIFAQLDALLGDRHLVERWQRRTLGS